MKSCSFFDVEKLLVFEQRGDYRGYNNMEKNQEEMLCN